MQSIKLDLKNRSYNIVVGYNIIDSLAKFVKGLKLGPDAYIITNPRIKNKYGRLIGKILKASGCSVKFRDIPDTEKAKSLSVLTAVINDLAAYDKKRRIFIVALGGGVVGDTAGFVASIYKRGIPYIQIPTTLLAQVDSAIGGKTGVDLTGAKNILGAFYQPRLVFSDVRFLRSLDKRQVSSGLAEVIKYALIKDSRLFSYLEKKYRDVLSLSPASLESVVRNCSEIKAGIVQQDEREERGIRTILNFGHTVGHAIEAAGKFRVYNHGEAVALGMLIAAGISRRLNFIDHALYKRIENLIKAVGLPLKMEKITQAGIINAHYRDKKFIGRKNRFVLIKGMGKAVIVEDVPLGIISDEIRKKIS